MDLISYRGIQMRVIQSLPHVRTVELDESRATYKWTRWDLSFIVTLEPTALSTSMIGIANNAIMPPNTSATPPPVRNAADIQLGDTNRTMPGLTDGQIRRFLEYPRGVLIVRAVNGIPASNQNIIVLRSPAVGSDRDANHGPFCKVNSIQEIAGEALWQIHLTFTTYIYEDSLASGGTPPVIISNRWATTTDTNELHLTDRIIDGIVHFRADRLANDIVIAEGFRKIFASFTVPGGFERKHVRCTTLPQGNMVRYHIVDREQPYQQSAGPQVRLEYTERSWMWRGSAGRAAGEFLGGLPDAPPIFGGPWAIGAWFRGRVTAPFNAIGKQLPKRYKTVIARAWGNRLVNRAVVVQRAMQLTQARLGQPALILPFTQETSVSYHSAQMMAQVESTINWSFNEGLANPATVLSVAALLFQNPGAAGLGDLTFEAFAEMSGDAASPQLAAPMLQLAPNRIQPPFPTLNQTHGTWPALDPAYLARLAAQTLETIGAAPASPP